MLVLVRLGQIWLGFFISMANCPTAKCSTATNLFYVYRSVSFNMNQMFVQLEGLNENKMMVEMCVEQS